MQGCSMQDLDEELARINARLGQSKRPVPVPVVPLEPVGSAIAPAADPGDPDSELRNIELRLRACRSASQGLSRGNAPRAAVHHNKQNSPPSQTNAATLPSASYAEFALGRGRKVELVIPVIIEWRASMSYRAYVKHDDARVPVCKASC